MQVHELVLQFLLILALAGELGGACIVTVSPFAI
jgi:hypothetical protein